MTSLGEAFAATFARRAAAPALLYDGRAYSFADVGRRATAIAATLAQRGVRPGDRVAVGLPNSPDLVATALGVIQAGAVLVPLNPASPAGEVVHIVRDSRPTIAVVTRAHATALEQTQLHSLTVEVDALRAAQTVQRGSLAIVQPDAPAVIVYTSGTTGRPKGVVLSHHALLSNLTTVAHAWQWTERDRLLLTLPCFHLHGLGLGIIASFLVGSSIVLRRRFIAAETLADAARAQATMFFGVPTMYNRLVALPAASFEAHDRLRMRLWVSGSAPLSAATFERFRTRCGAAILERYGMTECLFVLSAPYEGPRRPGVVGRPLPGISVRLVDPDAADGGRCVDVPDGTQGEIAIRGPNLFSGYWDRSEETQRTFVDGYFRSGDLALREPDGMLRILGRRSVDIIKTRGFKVSAVEIEQCLQRHPHVQEVAVVGVPDPDQGERIVAAIMPRAHSHASADAIRAYGREHLAPHKMPSVIVFIEEIPCTGPGKFKKKELIKRLSQ
ncbi:MAG: AMP-binding protein [Candidatus Binatia bacterium]